MNPDEQTEVNKVDEVIQPDENEVINNEQPVVDEVIEPVSNSKHWCKQKMSTCYTQDTQNVIKELAPGNVKNITQFTVWLLEDYNRLQQSTNAYNENQEDLNKKLQKAYEATDAYILKFTELETKYLDLKEQFDLIGQNDDLEETPPPANKVYKRDVLDDFLGLISF
jgi:DNA repair exonuclease SbcCD ATPase subunit